MNSSELVKIWNASHDSAARDEYEILRKIDETFVARSPSRTPALIIPLPDGDQPRGRVLGSMRLTFERSLRFDIEESHWSQSAAVLDCLDPSLLRTFSAVALDVIGQMKGVEATARRLMSALGAWDDLLRRRSKLTDEAELGLWGELYLISLAPNLDGMISAWRGPYDETMDFIAGGFAVECKTSARRHRHRISHHQASFEGDFIRPILASIWACDDPTSGSTLKEMVDPLADALVDEGAFIRKLMAVGYREEHQHEYSRRLGCPSKPRFFKIEHVPGIHTIDEGVSNIKYDVNLSRTPHLNEADVLELLSSLSEVKAG